ncbi:MAG: D-arabinose 5-phosphate isomerase [Gammaproteobacteria bacterium]|nr:MAG: D-arabinose 5-phosphate isomerase [Gammaproteobacteria bacterium]
MDNYITTACQVINKEAEALKNLSASLDENFTIACDVILKTTNRVIVMGIGKSGHIANKIASTMASTGTPAFFIHPTEAGHGDLGMIKKDDVLLLISNSGETAEILELIPALKKLGCKMISITKNKTSTLAKNSNCSLIVAVKDEACPLNLAPTSSTTATLALGDALAVALLEKKRFNADDFALSHPAGSLGKKLLLKVSDIMHIQDEIPKVDKNVTISDAILQMSAKSLGFTAIIDEQNKIIGIFTDGDLRRVLNQDIDIKTYKIADILSKSCTTITSDKLAVDALQLMEQKSINGLLVADNKNKLIGALNMHDILKAGI